MHWLLRFFAGETISDIARTDHTYREKVRNLMKSAALTLIDAAQEQLLVDVFPLTKQVLMKALEQQLHPKEGDKPVDTALAERVLKALYITEAPQLKTQLVRELGPAPETDDPEAEREVQTLAGFVAKRVLPPPRPSNTVPSAPTVIDVDTVKDGNAN